MASRNRARAEARAKGPNIKPVEVPMPEMKITDEQGCWGGRVDADVSGGCNDHSYLIIAGIELH